MAAALARQTPKAATMVQQVRGVKEVILYN